MPRDGCLRRRRLYDLVIDPAANVDVTKGSPRICGCGIEDNRSWRHLVTAHFHATRWRRGEQQPPPTRRESTRRIDRIAIAHSFGLSLKRGHWVFSREHGFYRGSFQRQHIPHRNGQRKMEVFGFQQSMMHCSKAFFRLPFITFLSQVQRTCVDPWFPLLSWTICPRPSPKLITSKIHSRRYQRAEFCLGRLWVGLSGDSDSASGGGRQERAFGQPELGRVGDTRG